MAGGSFSVKYICTSGNSICTLMVKDILDSCHDRSVSFLDISNANEWGNGELAVWLYIKLMHDSEIGASIESSTYLVLIGQKIISCSCSPFPATSCGSGS